MLDNSNRATLSLNLEWFFYLITFVLMFVLVNTSFSSLDFFVENNSITIIMCIFCVFFVLLSIYLFRNIQIIKERHQKELEAINEKFQKNKKEFILEKEKEIKTSIENLNSDLRNKTIELAKKSKENKENNNLLIRLKEKIDALEKNPTHNLKRQLTEMRRLINDKIKSEDQIFEIQIDEIHQTFFKVLKEKYPNLSLYDLRLSAYLKMGLNSKEIAELLKVLPSSINVSRSRLRKKLNLAPEEDLYKFLNEIE